MAEEEATLLVPGKQSGTLLAGAFDGWIPRTWASVERLDQQLSHVPQTLPPLLLASLLPLIPALDHLQTPAPSLHHSHNSAACGSQLRPARKALLSTSLLNPTEINKCYKSGCTFPPRKPVYLLPMGCSQKERNIKTCKFFTDVENGCVDLGGKGRVGRIGGLGLTYIRYHV